MKRRFVYFLCTGIWLFSVTPVFALSLHEAFELALKNHEAVHLARESMVQSELGIDKAYSEVLPSLTVEGIYTRFKNEKTASGFLLQPQDSTRFEVRVEQPIYSGGKSSSLIRQAKKKLTDSQKGVEEVSEEVIIITARAYYEVLKAKKEVEIEEASLRRVEEQRSVAEARLRVGAATKSELLRAEAEVAGTMAELTRAKSVLKDAEALLRRVTGVEGPIDVSPPEPEEPLEEPVEEFVELAFSKRKDYIRREIAEEIASEGIRFAKGNFMPSLTLEGVYSNRDQSPTTSFLLRDSTFAGLTFEFPIFEGGLRRAELREARSKLRQAELERRDRKREIELGVSTSYNNIGTAASVIDSFKRQVSFAEENYSMVFKQFTFGLSDSVDVIDADTTLVSAQRGLSRASFDYELATLELLKSAGMLLNEMENIMAGRD
jgi:outer membrane protein